MDILGLGSLTKRKFNAALGASLHSAQCQRFFLAHIGCNGAYKLDVFPTILQELDVQCDYSVWPSVRAEIVSRIKSDFDGDPDGELEAQLEAQLDVKQEVKQEQREQQPQATKARQADKKSKRIAGNHSDGGAGEDATAALQRLMPLTHEQLARMTVGLLAQIRNMKTETSNLRIVSRKHRQLKRYHKHKSKLRKHKVSEQAEAHAAAEFIQFRGNKHKTLTPQGGYTAAVMRNATRTAAWKFGMTQRIDTSRQTITRWEVRAAAGGLKVAQLFYWAKEREFFETPPPDDVYLRFVTHVPMGDATNAKMFHNHKLRSSVAASAYYVVKKNGDIQCEHRRTWAISLKRNMELARVHWHFT